MPNREALEAAMRRAFSIARLGPEHDRNPQVGCVIIDAEGRPVAEGWHRGSGTPHAEIEALGALSPELRERMGELTAVVTLEPCNHTGRTGPCAVALAGSGIGAVVYALDDPGSASGGGAETLRAAGVAARGGLLADEAREVIAPWLARQRAQASAPSPGRARDAAHEAEKSASPPHPANPSPGRARDAAREAEKSASPRARRPRITLKWAQTLDGRAAAADGSSRWITGVDARGDVHRRRAEADAILVGTGTLIADDPALTSRAETGGLLVPAEEQPVPVVLGHREIPSGARILEHPALEARGLAGPIRLSGDDLAADMAELAARGVRRLFVEGGPAVASSLLAAGLVDEVLVYVAPALLGGPKLALGDIGVADMAGIRRLRITHFAQLGADLLIKAVLEPPAGPGPKAAPTTEEEH